MAALGRVNCAFGGILLSAFPQTVIAASECKGWCGNEKHPWDVCCDLDKCSACDECAVAPPQCDAPLSTGSTSFDIATDISHRVNPSFLSFTLDLWTLHSAQGIIAEGDLTDPRNIALAKAMGPAILRLGGTAADNVTYDMSMPPEDPPYVPSSRGDDTPGAEIIPHGTLNATDWDTINAFALAAGWEIVFGLNIFDGWEQGTRTWDPTRSIALMKYTKAKGYPVVGWEIGNEPNLKKKYLTAAEDAKAISSLFDEIGQVYDFTGQGTRDSPWLIGPDVTKGQSEYMGAVLDELPSPGVDVVTWHHYYVAGSGGTVTACDFISVDLLEVYCEYAREASLTYKNYSDHRDPSRPTQLWMGETGGAGGATHSSKDVLNKFIAIFWYADKLGYAASTGHSVVARQTWMEVRGPMDNPAPDFWLALTWKRLMGQGVLSVTKTSGSTTTRSYAHCGTDGSVTAVVLNLANSSETVDLGLGGANGISLEEYHLTSWPSPGDLWTTSLAVNGQQAKLTDSGGVPDFAPRQNTDGTVAVDGLSVAFVVFPPGSVPCADSFVI